MPIDPTQQDPNLDPNIDPNAPPQGIEPILEAILETSNHDSDVTHELLENIIEQSDAVEPLLQNTLEVQSQILEEVRRPEIQKMELMGAEIVTIKGKQGDKGDDGYTPQKGIDYFTDEDIDEVVGIVQSKIRIPEDGKTPELGVDYFTEGDIREFIKAVIARIPKPKDGQDAVVDYDYIVRQTLKMVEIPRPERGPRGLPGKDAKLDANEIIRLIKGKLAFNDLSDAPTIFSQGRMGGSGYLKDLTDVELTSEPSNGQALIYDSAKKKWVPGAAVGGGGGSWGEILGDLEDQADLWAVLQSKVSQAEIDAAIDNLVAAAPGALDTLNELAAALGDDANFASTVTTALAGKSDIGHNHAGVYEPANANIQSHISNTSNPHSVTAAQVGLGSVQNYGIASQAEAEAGTSNVKYMTPLRVAEAIAALAGPGGGAAWGGITGTLSDQTDLQAALDAKADDAHTHAIGDITNLQTSLDGKVDENAAITGATKTKITYDAKGLVTGGADATQDDIGDGTTYKQYSATEKSKLAGIEDSADITDAANVAAAGAFMKSIDDTDDITEGSTKKFATAAEKTKLSHITVTQAVDLDDIETRVNNLDAAIVLKGTWDASAGTFPGGGTAQAGASYIVSVAGTVDGTAFAVNDRIIAITDNASTTTFANNWFKADYTDQVVSVNGSTGAVTLNQDNIGDGSTYKQYSQTEKTKLAGIETAADVTDADNVGAAMTGASGKTTPVDADTMPLNDSAASNVLKKVTWANVKATLKSYFDTLYAAVAHTHDDRYYTETEINTTLADYVTESGYQLLSDKETVSLLNYGPFALEELGADPANPSAGYIRVYARDDGKLYYRTSDGTETEIGGGGGSTLAYIAQTSTYAILTTDQVVNCTTGTFTVTLPTAVGATGKFYYIKNSGTGIITIATTSSQTIDGVTTFTLPTQYQSIKVVSNGANWIII